MSQYKTTPSIRMVAPEAVPKFSLVKPDGGVNDLTDRPIGVAMTAAYGSGDEYECRLLNAQGTQLGIAEEALSKGAILYTENGGTLQDTAAATSHPVGIAMEDASSGQVFEWLPLGPSFGGAAVSGG